MSQYTNSENNATVMQTNLQASIVNGLGFKFETLQPTAPEETGDAGPPRINKSLHCYPISKTYWYKNTQRF